MTEMTKQQTKLYKYLSEHKMEDLFDKVLKIQFADPTKRLTKLFTWVKQSQMSEKQFQFVFKMIETKSFFLWDF